jgi:hypothetical protein
MPNWKKLIYSGSAAVLSNVSASSYTGSFTGSFSGTFTSASYALSSSYALSASYAPPTAGASSQWTSSAANIYYNVGNVGINTINPAYNLDVSGSAIVRSKLRVGNVGTNGTIHSATAITANAGTTLVWTESGTAGAAAFLEYYTVDTTLGINQRAGIITLTWNSAGTPVTAYTETHTPDIGANPQISFSCSLSAGGDPQLYMINSSPYSYYTVINYRLF